VIRLALFLRLLALLAVLLVPATSFADDHDSPGPAAGSAFVGHVKHDSVQIEGFVKPGDRATTWWVEYGTSDRFGQVTAPAAVGGDELTYVSATLTGLPAATPHYVRLVAATSRSRSNGAAAKFTTQAAPATPAPADPTPGTSPQPAPSPETIPAPTLGETVVVAVAQGTVRVRTPGGDAFEALSGAESVPVGSVVDAREGSIALSSAREGGATQEAIFGGGRFAVRQSGEDGFVDLHLRGSMRRCRTDRQSGDRRLASAAAKRRKPARTLWGKDDHGRFRTHGRDSVATVRGTRWTMSDRCDGTVTKVTEGAVDVKVRHSGRVVRVAAGERHFARHRR